MSQRKLVFLVLFAGIIVATTWLVALFIPRSEEEVWSRELSRIDAERLVKIPPVAGSIAFYQNRLKENPKDAVGFTILGDLLMRQARETGDASKYQLAEEAFLRTLVMLPNYTPAQASLAVAYHAQHRFDEALETAKQAYEVDPRSIQALATIGDAYLELGMYEEAEGAYLQLRDSNPSPTVLARLSHLAYLKGNTAEAVALLKDATQQEWRSGQSKVSVAWYLVRSGDLLFDLGRFDEAEDHLEAALKLWDGYYLALSSMAKVRAAQGRNEEAIDLYERSVSIIPLPTNLAALGDLYSVIGNNSKAKTQYDTIELIAELGALNQVIYNRELALFYADHDINTNEAVELTKGELAVRKDVYGYDALAWSLLKAGHLNEASTTMKEAIKLGTRDAKLYYHAGMIHFQLGEAELALSYLKDAIELNPNFSIIQAEKARKAMEALENKLALSKNE